MSLHSTLRRLQKELTQTQAEPGWQPSGATGSVNHVRAAEAEPAVSEQEPPADAAAAVADDDDLASSGDTDASASTR